MSDGWIIVRNWERFQHYGNRHPVWIKNYPDLLRNQDYLDLSLTARGLLHGVWLLYAECRGQVRTKTLRSQLEVRTKSFRGQLTSLVNAGFIEIVASKPLALARAGARSREVEVEVEVETPQTPLSATTKKQKARAHLLEQAHQLAAGWHHGDSDEFGDQLETLERTLHARLTSLERDDLWAEAFRRKD